MVEWSSYAAPLLSDRGSSGFWFVALVAMATMTATSSAAVSMRDSVSRQRRAVPVWAPVALLVALAAASMACGVGDPEMFAACFG